MAAAVRADAGDPRTYVYETSASQRPMVVIAPGDQCRVGTLNAYTGRHPDSDDLLDPHFFDQVLPLTGPIAVRGARPGDWVAVTVRDIQTSGPGTLILRQGKGLLGHHWTGAPKAFQFSVENGLATNDELGSWPTKPMVGTLAVAHASETLWSGVVGDHAGNMDCPELALGATIVLPVQVPGALLYIGDGHALMGHGELGGTGIEIGLELELSVDLVAGPTAVPAAAGPLLRAGDGWLASIGRGASLDEASKAALSGLRAWLAHFPCDHIDARIALQGEARFCQVVNNLYTVAVGLYPQDELQRHVHSWLGTTG